MIKTILTRTRRLFPSIIGWYLTDTVEKLTVLLLLCFGIELPIGGEDDLLLPLSLLFSADVGGALRSDLMLSS